MCVRAVGGISTGFDLYTSSPQILLEKNRMVVHNPNNWYVDMFRKQM